MSRQSEILALRPFSSRHEDFFRSLATDERVTRFVGDGRPWTEDAVRLRVEAALIEADPSRVGAIRWWVGEQGQTPVGLFVSSRRVDGRVEIGYWISPQAWGQGVAGRLIDQALPEVRQVFGPAPLVARIARENTASIRLVERRGSRPEASESDGLTSYVLPT